MKFRIVVTAILVSLLFSGSISAQEITAAPTKSSGVYEPGEKIEWKIEVKGAKDVTQLSYTVKKGMLTIVKQGKLDLKDNVATLDASLDEPGTLLAEFKLVGGPAPAAGAKPARGLAGAVIAPDKIQPSAPPPDDFDAFWQKKLEELAAVPPNAKVEPADGGKPTIEYAKVQLDNIRGTHIYGQLAKPKKEGKFPALLVVQYAGVYGLPKTNVTSRAEQGWLALNIMAHDLPFDQPKEFYDKLSAGELKDYVAIGSDDREKSYFLRMCLGCYRAADYLASRPDWDGKTLVVTGTSQGGYQTFVTAGLHPKITAMLANVAAGCDVTAKQANRAAGWPYWESKGYGGRDVKKVMETSRYFDAVNFARRAKCPALVSMGLIDETCPAAGLLSAYSVLQGEKERLVLPLSNHHGDHGAQNAYWSRSEQWLRALAKGEEPPALAEKKK